MFNYFLAFLTIIAIIAIGEFCFKDSIQNQIRRKLKEDEKDRLEKKDIEQQLKDEDKYDNNYRKRHS